MSRGKEAGGRYSHWSNSTIDSSVFNYLKRKKEKDFTQSEQQTQLDEDEDISQERVVTIHNGTTSQEYILGDNED